MFFFLSGMVAAMRGFARGRVEREEDALEQENGGHAGERDGDDQRVALPFQRGESRDNHRIQPSPSKSPVAAPAL